MALYNVYKGVCHSIRHLGAAFSELRSADRSDSELLAVRGLSLAKVAAIAEALRAQGPDRAVVQALCARGLPSARPLLGRLLPVADCVFKFSVNYAVWYRSLFFIVTVPALV